MKGCVCPFNKFYEWKNHRMYGITSLDTSPSWTNTFWFYTLPFNWCSQTLLWCGLAHYLGFEIKKSWIGSQREEIRTFTKMSILQKAQNKKGKAAEKSPLEEQPPEKVGSVAVAELDSRIHSQGDKVRQLKTDKAPKVTWTQFFFTDD